MDYEKMKNLFLFYMAERGLDITSEDAAAVIECLNLAASEFDISTKCTELAVINKDFIPATVKEYLIIKKIEGLSEQTLYSYRIILQIFFEKVRKEPEEVMKNDIMIFLYWYKEMTKVQDATLDKYREYICRFFNWSAANGYVSNNPALNIKPIKFEKKERKAMTESEFEIFRNAASNLRDKAIIETFFSTGCRCSELSILKKSDINWESGEVKIFGKGKKHRTSFMNAAMRESLSAYLETRRDDSDALFVGLIRPHNPLCKRSIEAIITKVANNANIQTHVTPHVIRHTSATLALKRGMPIEDISKFLGHANINTTMIYAKQDMTKVQSEHEKFLF